MKFVKNAMCERSENDSHDAYNQCLSLNNLGVSCGEFYQRTAHHGDTEKMDIKTIPRLNHIFEPNLPKTGLSLPACAASC